MRATPGEAHPRGGPYVAASAGDVPPMIRRLALGAAIGIAAIVALSVILVLPWRWVAPPTTAFMVRERIASGGPIYYDWTPLKEISEHLPFAVVAAEDQKFPEHHGFDWEAIRGAMERNQSEEGPLRGGSTISQQLAKNLYLWPAQSWVRKGIEAYLTTWIEILWPKRRILEVYVNVVEFGPNVFGAKAAADQLIGRPVGDLGPRDAALLAAVLPSPKRFSARSPSAYVRGRADQILQFMSQLGGPDYIVDIRAGRGVP